MKPAFAIGAAIGAGVTADVVNSAMLWGFDAVGVPTAHGGLLRLLRGWGNEAASALAAAPLPVPTPAFQVGFHATIGLVMALGYALLLEPRLPGPAWGKALVTALAVWLVNAALVLPATGEGFAGSRHLGPAGLAAFALAHTAFFLVLAPAYAGLRGGGAASAAVSGR